MGAWKKGWLWHEKLTPRAGNLAKFAWQQLLTLRMGSFEVIWSACDYVDFHFKSWRSHTSVVKQTFACLPVSVHMTTVIKFSIIQRELCTTCCVRHCVWEQSTGNSIDLISWHFTIHRWPVSAQGHMNPGLNYLSAHPAQLRRALLPYSPPADFSEDPSDA